MIQVSKTEIRATLFYIWIGFNGLLWMMAFSKCTADDSNMLNLLSGMGFITAVAAIVLYLTLCGKQI